MNMMQRKSLYTIPQMTVAVLITLGMTQIVFADGPAQILDENGNVYVAPALCSYTTYNDKGNPFYHTEPCGGGYGPNSGGGGGGGSNSGACCDVNGIPTQGGTYNDQGGAICGGGCTVVGPNPSDPS